MHKKKALQGITGALSFLNTAKIEAYGTIKKCKKKNNSVLKGVLKLSQ